MKADQSDPALEEYAKLADLYDWRWSFYIEATIRETLARFRPEPGGRLLDVGCGTGALLKVLSLAYPEMHLAGVDPSAEMLGVARAKLPPSVHLSRAPAESLPFPDSSFDTVASTSAFHHFHDSHRALNEIERVLVPSGRIVITDWCHDYLSLRLCVLALRIAKRAHFRVYGSTQFRELLLGGGFEAVEVERYKINWLWGLMTGQGTKPK